jgi:uncharacterized protein YjbI with pentapeptide repeats
MFQGKEMVMRRKFFTLLIAVCGLITFPVVAFDRSSRLSALNEFDVNKNSSILLRTNRCRGCYLAYAKLSGMDLAGADLSNANLIGATFIEATLFGAKLDGAKIAGANFTGAQWVDGSVCQTGSVGRCIILQQ